MKKPAKIQPKPVQKIFCPTCKEIMCKFYPYSSIGLVGGTQPNPCGRCMNKQLKSLKT